ncbi:MAG: asparagine synthase-related protein [Pseudomonadota bacterium]|nr:asparagine synthase-related protein [Pseudomonadota bacterium]
MAGERGVILGHAFQRGDGATCISGTTDTWLAENHEHLLKRLWGAYIAVIINDRGMQVVRDPSGLLPCYYVQAHGVFYFAPDAALLAEQGVLRPQIDWSQLARALYASDLPEERTALDGVRHLLPGMVIDIDRTAPVARLAWTPWDHAGSKDITPSELREKVLKCVTRWQEACPSMMVAVSGGLDSSIVAACLRDRASCRALTISADDAHGDESGFARALCHDLDMPLTEARYDLAQVDIDRSAFAHLPRPGGRAQLLASDAAVSAAATHHGVDACLTGLGGDNVFYFTTSVRPLVDRYRVHGLRPALLDTMTDISKLAGINFWATLRAAFQFPRAGDRQYRWRPDTRFLNSALVNQLAREPLDHPWLSEPPGALPGKAAHIAQLVRAQSYVDAHDRRLPFALIHPLLSQPIVEAALAIPSWEACEGGIDRSQARRAFRHDLPRSVLDRRQKGGPDGFAFQILRANLDGIRERLMDGTLASQQIIDRDAIHSALREENLARGEDYVRILLLLDTEAWVRGWLAQDTVPIAA